MTSAPQQFHLVDIDVLAGDIDGAHENLGFHAEQRPDHGGCQAVLAGAGFGDELLFAHVAGRASPGPRALLTLWAPPCSRSSRLT